MRVKLWIAAAWLIIALAAVPAPPASAVPPPDCSAPKICLYEHSDYGGAVVKLDSTDRRIRNKLAHQMNNMASSIYNPTQFAIRLFDKKDGQGEMHCYIAPFTDTDFYNPPGTNFNDVASSSKVLRSNHC